MGQECFDTSCPVLDVPHLSLKLVLWYYFDLFCVLQTLSRRGSLIFPIESLSDDDIFFLLEFRARRSVLFQHRMLRALVQFMSQHL